nr:carcinoembryonic antigen-related cell adhesion molecule 21-like [Loxodonta africana]
MRCQEGSSKDSTECEQMPEDRPIHSSRKTIYPNGSLLFQNVTLENTENYILQITKTNGDKEILAGQIRVYQSVTKPSIQASNTAVTEHEGPVTLTCLTNHTGISIHWVFQGQILQLAERMMLSQDNSSLTTDPIRRRDAGEYHCEVSNPVSSSKSDLLILTMNRDDSVPESSGLLVRAIASIVVGVLARVALIRNTAGCDVFPHVLLPPRLTAMLRRGKGLFSTSASGPGPPLPPS